MGFQVITLLSLFLATLCIVPLVRPDVVFGEQRKLILTQLVFRHGNRTPLWFYESSFCPSSVYRDGPGAIINAGVEGAFSFGKLLRRRYVDTEETRILDGNFLSSQVHARTSDVDRCVQTCLAVLAGLFPPNGTRHNWNHQLNWQPVPIHNFRADDDPILRAEGSRCNKLNELLKSKWDRPEIVDLIEKNKDLLDSLSKKSGSDINKRSLWNFFQTLAIEVSSFRSSDQECKRIPAWVNDDLLQKLETLVVALLNTYYSGNGDEFALLLGGPLLTEILHNIQKTSSSHEDNKKMYLYSGHDSTLYQLIAALEIKNEPYPNFLASFIFEAYKNRFGVVDIEMYRFGGPSVQTPFEKIPIPRCPYPCFLDDFYKKYSDVVSTDRHLECFHNDDVVFNKHLVN